MALHIIIDGYNFLWQSSLFSPARDRNIRAERETLLKLLAGYKEKTSHRITVVFDGKNAPFFLDRRDIFRGVDVLFSREGEDADTVIMRMASRERERALVVSSDRRVTDFSEHQGAASINCPGFEEKIVLARRDSPPDPPPDQRRPRFLTKKRGPGKRLKKRDRKNRLKTDKL